MIGENHTGPAAGVLGAFYAAAAHEYERAARHEDIVERHLRFADRRLRLRFAGGGLSLVLLGALAHRCDDSSGDVDATISLWEGASCPGGPIPRPWNASDVGPGGLVRGSDVGQVRAVHDTYSGALTLFDRGDRALLHRVPHHGAVPWWDRAAPLRPALFWALGGEGRHLVHAGAVGDDRGGVVLVGPAGSGKTTVARAALSHGFGCVADDYLLLDVAAEPTAFSLYSTVSVRSRTDAEVKVVLDLPALMPGSMRESLAVRAVVVPRIISGGSGRLSRRSPADTLLAWAPSTALQMPFDRAMLATLAALVRGVPCFEMEVGDDEAALASAVDRILQWGTG